jgi:hypothetical protein
MWECSMRIGEGDGGSYRGGEMGSKDGSGVVLNGGSVNGAWVLRNWNLPI